MQELDTPLRLTWSLGGETCPLDGEALKGIARRIVDAGVMFVTLEGRPLQHPGCEALLELLSEHACQVSLVVPDDTGVTSDLPVQGIALDAGTWFGPSGLDLEGLKACLERLRIRGCEVSLWLAVLKGYLPEIPRLLDFARECKVGKIKLSNLPIDASFGRIDAGQIPRPEDLHQVENVLRQAAVESRGKFALEIHDRFLWEVLADNEASLAEYGGCQAANSLAHIDAHGIVHPCSSWVQPLGDLLTTPFEGIWASAARHAVRAALSEVPDGCKGCDDYQECFAGCRGLSASYNFANQGRDPLCAGRR